MIELGVWAAIIICMCVSLAISYWGGGGRSPWLKACSFLVASLVGTFLFPFLSGLWQGATPQQEHLIDAAFRKQAWVDVGGVIAMAYFGAWRLHQVVEAGRRRN